MTRSVRSKTTKNTYSDYLQVDRLLSSQKIQTGSDDELLFIVIHQTHELWFKLAIHELDCAIRALMREGADNRDCMLAYKRLARVSEIEHILIASWSVLGTLTPDEFFIFRESVGRDNASGFQSSQYRILEFKLGLKYRTVDYETMVDGRPAIKTIQIAEDAKTQTQKDEILKALRMPSIYDAVIDFIAHRFAFSPKEYSRKEDFSDRHRKSSRIFNAWLSVYGDRMKHPELYQLGEKLIDLEDAFRRWRFGHLATVSRVIGGSAGTGGSSGLRYLRNVANQLIDHPIYPELWDVRTALFNRTEFDLAKAGYPDEG
jgi:tryptophan 2,3-dioxygenase